MRILVLFNPFAGAGRAPAMARVLDAGLTAAGHSCTLLESRPGPAAEWLDGALEEGIQLLVVVGGDGAVRLACAAASRSGVPLWQCPLGTENLFARQWGMRRGVPPLLEAIGCRVIVESDLGDADGEAFTLMASIGFDADVVHELAVRRRGRISHLSYVKPILRTAIRHRAKRLRVFVDGVRLDDGPPGFLVAANARRYALGIDPVPDADPSDGELDACWFPAAGLPRLAAWSILCAARCQGRCDGLRTGRGLSVVVESDDPFLYQLDGDPPSVRSVGSAVTRLSLGLRPERLLVLAGRPR